MQVLERCLEPGKHRLIVFHDGAYQRARVEPSYPEEIERFDHALTHVIRLPAAVRDVAASSCRNLDQFTVGDGRVAVYPLFDEGLIGSETQLVEVEGSSVRQADSFDDAKYLSYLGEGTQDDGAVAPGRGSVDQEEAYCFNKYAEQLANVLDKLADEFPLENGIPKFRGDLVAILLPHTDCERINTLRAATANQVENDAVRDVLKHQVRVGEFAKSGLFMGPVECFIGMERPLIIVLGFRSPAYLLERGERGDDLASQVDGLLYQAVTRCNFRLTLIEFGVQHFARWVPSARCSTALVRRYTPRGNEVRV